MTHPPEGFESLSLGDMLRNAYLASTAWPDDSPEQTVVVGQYLTPIMHKQHAQLMTIPVTELGKVAEHVGTT